MPDPAQPHGEKYLLLIINDCLCLQNIIIHLLTHHQDIEVVGTAANIEDAVIAVERVCPHIILLNLDSSGSGGLNSVGSLHNTLPNSRIIALSMFEEPVYTQKIIAAGADGHVCKQQLMNDLISEIYRGK